MQIEFFKTTTYGAPVASITAPDGITNKHYRNYDDPISMLDRGNIMTVADPVDYNSTIH